MYNARDVTCFICSGLKKITLRIKESQSTIIFHQKKKDRIVDQTIRWNPFKFSSPSKVRIIVRMEGARDERDRASTR